MINYKMKLTQSILSEIYKNLSEKDQIKFSNCCKKTKYIYDKYLYMNNKTDIEKYISLTGEEYLINDPLNLESHKKKYYYELSEYLSGTSGVNCIFCYSSQIVIVNCEQYFGYEHTVCNNCIISILTDSGYDTICKLCYNLCDTCSICNIKFICEDPCHDCGDKVCINCKITLYEGKSCDFLDSISKCQMCISKDPYYPCFCENITEKKICRRDIITCNLCKNVTSIKKTIQNPTDHKNYCFECHHSALQ